MIANDIFNLFLKRDLIDDIELERLSDNPDKMIHEIINSKEFKALTIWNTKHDVFYEIDDNIIKFNCMPVQTNIDTSRDCIYLYNNILINVPSTKLFSEIIAIDNQNRPIPYSNSYLFNLIHKNVNYEQMYHIYRRLMINRNILAFNFKYPNDKIIRLNGRYINFSSSFYSTNSGHYLTVIFNCLDKMKNLKFDKIIIIENTIHFNKKILDLFFKEEQYEILKTDQIYSIEYVYFIRPIIFSILRYKKYADKIIKKINSMLNDRGDLKNLKIILLKTNKEKVLNNRNIYFKYKYLENIAINHGYTILLPEKTDPYEMIFMLNHAKIIITQQGSISYTNFLFFNNNCKIIHCGLKCYDEIIKLFGENVTKIKPNLRNLMHKIRDLS